jgi:hypothetical protein
VQAVKRYLRNEETLEKAYQKMESADDEKRAERWHELQEACQRAAEEREERRVLKKHAKEDAEEKEQGAGEATRGKDSLYNEFQTERERVEVERRVWIEHIKLAEERWKQAWAAKLAEENERLDLLTSNPKEEERVLFESKIGWGVEGPGTKRIFEIHDTIRMLVRGYEDCEGGYSEDKLRFEAWLREQWRGVDESKKEWAQRVEEWRKRLPLAAPTQRLSPRWGYFLRGPGSNQVRRAQHQSWAPGSRKCPNLLFQGTL